MQFCKRYYDYIRVLRSTLTEDQVVQFNDLYSKFILTQADERDEVDAELTRTFPQIYKQLTELNQHAADAYKKVVDSGLFDDFDKYIKIDNIDD